MKYPIDAEKHIAAMRQEFGPNEAAEEAQGPEGGTQRGGRTMGHTITLEGAAAVKALEAVNKARSMWPVLNGLSDGQILELLITQTIAKETDA